MANKDLSTLLGLLIGLITMIWGVVSDEWRIGFLGLIVILTIKEDASLGENE